MAIQDVFWGKWKGNKELNNTMCYVIMLARTGQSRFATAFSCPINPTNATAPLAPNRVANQVQTRHTYL